MLYEYFCNICEEYFEKVKPIQERHNVYCCGKKASKLISLPNTHKDKAYSFTTDMFDGKDVEVRSKGHYKSLLKKYGIADASPRECFDQARKFAKSREIDRNINHRKRAKVITEKFRSGNMMKEGKEILTKLTKSREEV